MAHFAALRYFDNPLTATMPVQSRSYGMTITHCTLPVGHIGDHSDGFSYGRNNIITEEA